MNDDLKEKALMKRDFINSEFGKFAAERISQMHADLHVKAESEDITPAQKAMYIDQAAGVSKVMAFFANDVVLLEQGHFDKEEDEPEQP